MCVASHCVGLLLKPSRVNSVLHEHMFVLYASESKFQSLYDDANLRAEASHHGILLKSSLGNFAHMSICLFYNICMIMQISVRSRSDSYNPSHYNGIDGMVYCMDRRRRGDVVSIKFFMFVQLIYSWDYISINLFM